MKDIDDNDLSPNEIAAYSQLTDQWQLLRQMPVHTESVKAGLRSLSSIGLVEMQPMGGTGHTKRLQTYRYAQKPVPSLRDVTNKAAELFNRDSPYAPMRKAGYYPLTGGKIRGPQMNSIVTRARQALVLALRMRGVTNHRVAKWLGQDHSSTVYAERAAKLHYQNDPIFKDRVDQLAEMSMESLAEAA